MPEYAAGTNESDRLAALGYRQELSRVLSLFDNFAVAFSYLSPMVGIYSLYTLGIGTGGPRYIWTIPIVVGLMMLVALVFGELASEYPLSGRALPVWKVHRRSDDMDGSSGGSTVSHFSQPSLRSTPARSDT